MRADSVRIWQALNVSADTLLGHMGRRRSAKAAARLFAGTLEAPSAPRDQSMAAAATRRQTDDEVSVAQSAPNVCREEPSASYDDCRAPSAASPSVQDQVPLPSMLRTPSARQTGDRRLER